MYPSGGLNFWVDGFCLGDNRAQAPERGPLPSETWPQSTITISSQWGDRRAMWRGGNAHVIDLAETIADSAGPTVAAGLGGPDRGAGYVPQAGRRWRSMLGLALSRQVPAMGGSSAVGRLPRPGVS